MADTDFEVVPGAAAGDLAGAFSSLSAPGQPATSCPLAAAAGKGSAADGLKDGAAESAPKLEGKAAVSTDDDPEIGGDYKWIDKEGSLKKYGDDKNNFQLGAYQASLSSGISKVDGGAKLDLISGSAEVDGVKAQGQKDLFGGVADVKGEVQALSAQANIGLGAELSDTKKAIEASAGAEANWLKAEGSGEIKIPLPFNRELVLGGSLEGRIGAAASASAGAGWSKEDGYFLEAKLKAALGLGGGAGFTIGVKDRNG